jgi:hypothetical protein
MIVLGRRSKEEKSVRLAAGLITAASLAALLSPQASALPAFQGLGLQQAAPPAQSEGASPTVFTANAAPAHRPLSDGVVVPLTDAPFAQLINPSSRVAFDFLGSGQARPKGWLTAGAAWLVWDPNWRGDVRTGADLVSAHTWSMVWADGFAALAALDTNHDGVLTGDELGGLALWVDANCDGISEPNEVMPVEAHGIVSISVRGERTAPGLATAQDGVRFDNGQTRPLYDWTPGASAAPREHHNHLHFLF